jgi:hypothetical protein
MEFHVSEMKAEIEAGYTPPKGDDRTCLGFWFPKIVGIVPTPRTEIIRTNVELWRLLEGEIPDDYYLFLDRLVEAAIRIDGLFEDNMGAAFLRTGHTSGKHDWSRCCYLTHDLDGHVRALVEFSAMAGFFGLPTEVWAVREYLPVEPLFRCTAYGGMPVVPERRYFVDGGELLYSIPYWPEQALLEGNPDDTEWREKLPVVQQEFGPEAEAMARECGEACGGKWSVDVLLTRDGYYVTDMAEAEQSWGWRGIK